MPLTGFRIADRSISFEEGPALLDREGIMPAAAVREVIEKERTSGAEHSFISPSGCNPDTTCRRERLIKEFLPYEADPRSFGETWEGTLVHDRLAGAMGMEITLPGPPGPEYAWHSNDMKDNPRYRFDNPPGSGATWEVFEGSGIFMKGTLDLVDGDLTDYKTVRFPKNHVEGRTPWEPPDFAAKHEIQLNIYGYLAEDFGIPVKNLWVWRFYRGCPAGEFRWRKYPIPRVARDAMWKRIGEWLTQHQRWFEACDQATDAAAAEEIIKTAPLEGLNLFVSKSGGNKCVGWGSSTGGCQCKAVCDRLSGALAW